MSHEQGSAGGPAAAAGDLAGVLADRERVLGLDHPDTMTVQDTLDYRLWEAAAVARHAILERRDDISADDALADFAGLFRRLCEVLGPDHPETLAGGHALAMLQWEAGLLDADYFLTAVMAKRYRVLGPDHPDTLATRVTFAQWQGRAGGPAWGAGELEGAFEQPARMPGADRFGASDRTARLRPEARSR